MSEAEEAPERNLLDTLSTVALLVVLAVLWGFLTFVGAFSALASDVCGGTPDRCDDTVMNLGWYGAMLSPTVLGLVTLGVTVARLFSARGPAFVVPLIGGAAMALTSWGFLALLESGTP